MSRPTVRWRLSIRQLQRERDAARIRGEHEYADDIGKIIRRQIRRALRHVEGSSDDETKEI